MKNIFSLPKELFNWARHFLLRTQLGRFLVVGGSAFVVNVLLLSFFYKVLDLPILAAQIIAAEGTIAFSFTLHHHWTYRNYQKRSPILRFLEFNLSALGGSIISTLSVVICVQQFGLNYLVGLSLGAILAIAWNYFANLYFIWTKHQNKQSAQSEQSEN